MGHEAKSSTGRSFQMVYSFGGMTMISSNSCKLLATNVRENWTSISHLFDAVQSHAHWNSSHKTVGKELNHVPILL